MSNWISVAKEKPCHGRMVLIYDKTVGEPEIGMWTNDFGWCQVRTIAHADISGDLARIENNDVTHWQIFPESPK